jgi:Site-specific DNA methylase
MGGPPCQGFSTANRQNVLNDPRNKLYLTFLKVIEIIKPKFVLIENVNGIKKISKEIISRLSNIGYHADFKTLQSSEFGIPQNRKRVFFLGVKKSNKSINKINKFFDYLENIKLKQKKYNLKDALFNLRPVKAKKLKNDTKNENFESGFNIEKSNSKKVNSYIKKINNNKKINFVYNHKARFNNERDIKIFGLLPQGGDSTHQSIKKNYALQKKRRDFQRQIF